MDARDEGVGLETSTDQILRMLEIGVVKDRTTRRTAPDALRPTRLNANAAWRALVDATTALRAAIAEGDGLADEKTRRRIYALLLWDQIIILAPFHDPMTCDCADCLQSKEVE